MEDFTKYTKALQQIEHYVYALCEIDEEKRTPFYIGKGVGSRCLAHLKEKNNSPKKETIKKLLDKGTLGIDILRHGIKTDQMAKLIEATCIDLLGIGELSNKVRGSGVEMGRATLEEVHNLQSGELVDVRSEHQGLAFLLNTTYKSGMSELELFESTRGVWRNVPRDENIKYAYATYGGLIKEVYQIHSWVPAGTQQYFTRAFDDIDISQRWEFIGKRASTDVRRIYVGKVIKKDRSFGNPFIKVGNI